MVFMGAGRHWHIVVLFAHCCVFCTFWLSLLGGCDSCCYSWMAGIVSAGGLHVMLHGGDMVAKQMWVVVGRRVEVVGVVIGMVVVG